MLVAGLGYWALIADWGGGVPVRRFLLNTVLVAAGLETIEQTSHEALEEMRRRLTVMRAPDQCAAPPILGQLDTILDAARQAGWRSALMVEGEPVRLSAGLNLAAYRIIQEAPSGPPRPVMPAACP